MAEANWYVVHTYSGYENKVKANIDKAIENRHLQEQILEVKVPMLDVVELKRDKKDNEKLKEAKAEKKMFPGYVLIHMVMNDDTWYVVRNTRGVTGFVGPDSKPVPLTESEVKSLEGMSSDTEISTEDSKKENIIVDFEVGDLIRVVGNEKGNSRAWKGTVAPIQSINPQEQTVTINVELFRKETPVEISLTDIEKL